MSRRWAMWEDAKAPDVDNPTGDYMVRLRIVQTPWFGIHLHRFNTPDRRSTLHDHPWPFLSLVLRGGYTEDFGIRAAGSAAGPPTLRRQRTWRVGSIHRMCTTDAHTITALHRCPTWTLLVVGRRRPEPSWGYWQAGTWVPHDQHAHGAEFAAALATRSGHDSGGGDR